MMLGACIYFDDLLVRVCVVNVSGPASIVVTYVETWPLDSVAVIVS